MEIEETEKNGKLFYTIGEVAPDVRRKHLAHKVLGKRVQHY